MSLVAKRSLALVGRTGALRPAAAVTLAAHHKPFGSARIARCRRGLDLVGALPAVWRAERRGVRDQESLPRWEIDTRPGPDPYKDGPERPRTDIRMPRTSP